MHIHKQELEQTAQWSVTAWAPDTSLSKSLTSQDEVTALCLLSSLSCGESLQRAAIISFQTTEEEEFLQSPHWGEEDEAKGKKRRKKKKKKDPNPHRPPSSCPTVVEIWTENKQVSEITAGEEPFVHCPCDIAQVWWVVTFKTSLIIVRFLPGLLHPKTHRYKNKCRNTLPWITFKKDKYYRH